MEVERGPLVEAVQRVMPAISRTPIFDQADKLLFWNSRLVSYNDEISISTSLSGLESIEGAVDGRKLLEFLNRTTAAKIIIESESDQIKFRAGHARASFSLLPLSLPLSEIETGAWISDVPPELSEHIVSASSVCSKYVAHRVLTAVRVFENLVEASDGYQAVRMYIDGVNLPSLLIPYNCSRILTDYSIKKISVSENEKWVHFIGEKDTIISTRTLDLTYPETDHLFNMKGDQIEFPTGMTEALQRAGVFSQRDQDVDEEVSILVQPGRIILRSQCEGASFSESVRSNLKITASFSLRPDFLELALKKGTKCLLGDRMIKFSSENWEHIIPLRITK
jgi:hypothetical protein